MSDNPFSEPADNDRTIIRPSPGGRRPTAPPPEQTNVAPVRPQPASSPPPAPSAAPSIAEGAENVAIGTSPLSAAAAPLLQLLARLRNTVRPPDSGDLREHTVRAVRQFEQEARGNGVPMEQLRPAHYALCASLDDVVLNTPWGSAGGWGARSLVSTFHNEVRSGERFFDLLNQMKDNPGRFLPVLELMYMCLSLGFVGQYRLSARGIGDIERVREETYGVIARQRTAAAAELSPHWQGLDAPYRASRARLPIWVAASVGLAAIAGLWLWLSTGLGAASDTVFERMRSAPPGQMPQISRIAPVPPPSIPPPDPAKPTVLDHLREFLKPEIDQGLVTVTGTTSTPIIRLRNQGMFGSGSAELQKASRPVLERVGAALKTEPGRIEVIGYTDNQPIRTVRFPSNFQLSVARAKAATAALATAVGDPKRLVAEGRADADPIAPNDKPEGRELNRRIEVVLHRQG